MFRDHAIPGVDERTGHHHILQRALGTSESLDEAWAKTKEGYPIPLLDLVEALEKRDRDEDDDGLLAVTNLNLQNSRKRSSIPVCRERESNIAEKSKASIRDIQRSRLVDPVVRDVLFRLSHV